MWLAGADACLENRRSSLGGRGSSPPFSANASSVGQSLAFEAGRGWFNSATGCQTADLCLIACGL